jgi:hypothetical protein
MVAIVGDRTLITGFSSPCLPIGLAAHQLLSFPYPLMLQFLNPEGVVNYQKSDMPRTQMQGNLNAFALAHPSQAGYSTDRSKGVFHWTDFHLTWEFVSNIPPYNGWRFVVVVPELTDKMFDWADRNHWNPHSKEQTD